jgi:tricorn protease
MRALALAVMMCAIVPTTLSQVDARMLQFPDVSATQIVFSYAGDLWVVAKEGGTANRLSSPHGQESFPHFSPDGRQIAFCANYDGNQEVYVIPATGGIPVRVTYSGAAERVVDWYPDGKDLVIASGAKSGRARYSQFYRVAATGGLPALLPIPYGEIGSLSPDGKRLAYTAMTQAFRTWKRYRGGWAPDIMIFDLQKNSAEVIAKDPASDEFPMWHGQSIYFLSDRGPEQRSNLWVYNLDSKKVRQLTSFKDEDIHFPSAGPSDIVFEAGGKLYLLDLSSDAVKEVQIKVVTDEISLLPRTENASRLLQDITVGPDGKRGLMEARGDIFSVPAEHGPVINLTHSSGSAERYPAWSPDGRMIAYWSDRTGEYELNLLDASKPGVAQTVTSYGPGFRYQIFWSPNSKKLAFIDKGMQIRVLDVESRKTTDVDKQLYFFQGNLAQYQMHWSPDSRWLAYARELPNRSSAIFVFDSREGKSIQLTSGYYADQGPVFDPGGKYLFYLTNRTFRPIYSDVDNSWIYPNSTSIAAAALAADTPSPLAPQNDTTGLSKAAEKKDEKKDDKKTADEKGKEEKATVLESAGFEERVVLLPPAAGNIVGLDAVAGKVIFRRSPNTGSADKKNPLMYFDLDKREEKTIVDDVDLFEMSADHKKILVGKGGSYAIVDVGENQKMDKKMPTSTLEVTVDPRAEWRQIFNDVWRFERDFFYDPNMHGVDWQLQRVRYGKMLESAVTRWDVNYVIGELIAELNASHTYRGGGDVESEPSRPFGYLGVDWTLENGAYRIGRIIRGAPWDAEVRSPFSQSGLRVKEGDYLLAVNGLPVDTHRPPDAAFEGLAGKTVEVTINSEPSLEGSRKIIVETLTDESRLRYLNWVEGNRQRVDKASGGKVGYIYVPSTGTDGQTELERQFAAQYDKEGLIVDERFNSGGQIPDRFIELLNRPPLAFWAVRDGATWRWPPMGHFGPTVMLINGWSGSGGDAFPDYFRKAGLGPLIGMRTWGGLIGISGAPSLIDGGNVTVPTFRMYNPDGTWFREGHGVDPDIEVFDDPGALARGVDPQLEKGIEEVMKRIAAAKPPVPHQPAFEKR